MPPCGAGTHRPLSRAEFDRRFPDEAACAEHLAALRWPEGFVCPSCEGRKGWRLAADRGLWECAGCRRQTSVTAGTALHRSKLPPRAWFTALHIVTRFGALPRTQRHQLAAAPDPVGPGQLRGLVEVDDANIPCRSKDDGPTAGSRGRSHLSKVALIGAVEIDGEGRPGRAGLAVLPDHSAGSIGAFVRSAVTPKSGLLTGGLPASARSGEARNPVLGQDGTGRHQKRTRAAAAA